MGCDWGGSRTKILFILNDAPYGCEHAYNGLRLASAMLKNDSAAEVTIFLLADAVTVARKGQKTPEGDYNIERMHKRITSSGHRMLLWSTCMDARGLVEEDLVEGAARSSMDELARTTVAADKVLVS